MNNKNIWLKNDADGIINIIIIIHHTTHSVVLILQYNDNCSNYIHSSFFVFSLHFFFVLSFFFVVLLSLLFSSPFFF